MDEQAELARLSAMKGLSGLASTAIMGVVALCHEMAFVGMLDARAVDRVSELMLSAIEQAGASADVETQLTQALTRHFADLRRHLE
jgi:phage FluMu protein gp41